MLAGNIAGNWRKFKQEFELYMLAAGYDTKPPKQKIALLLHVARKQAIEVYNTFSFTAEEEGKYETFNAYCNPKKNETYERHVFHSRKQLQGEPIKQFITDLKLKAQTCHFDNLIDIIIRDRLVHERLLREDDLDLVKAVKYVRLQRTKMQTRRPTTNGLRSCVLTIARSSLSWTRS